MPRDAALPLHRDLTGIVRAEGALPALVAVVGGRPTTSLPDEGLAALLASGEPVPKLNTSNLGAAMAAGRSGATTVSTTMELAAAAGIRVFATGGLGGVHPGYGSHLDISADLAALARFPVAVVCAGAKSILDLPATRELLETLGVPVVGYRTDEFPAFYLRRSTPPLRVDVRFDSVERLAVFVRHQLARSGRGIVVANPIEPEHELDLAAFAGWLREAEAAAIDGAARDRTPRVLAELHRRSGGATLRANIELVRSNVRLAAKLAVAMRAAPPKQGMC